MERHDYHVDQVPGGHRPLAAWKGKDRIGGNVLSTLTIILKTAGCRWNRCRMCSYRHVRLEGCGTGDISSPVMSQVEWIGRHFSPDDIEAVKIYTSGSFFDPKEVPLPARNAMGHLARGKIVIAETRPEFVTEDAVRSFLEIIDDGTHRTPLYVAMGLETTNDMVREKCINKGFSLRDFLHASRIARSEGAGVKAYLLAKPPFLTEREAIEDMASSIRDCSTMADLVSLNPCSVQKGTELEYYWKMGSYRPPYLWSILSILARAPIHVTCDPLGGGRERGAHNCGKCDRPLLDGIRSYSLSADRSLLCELLETDCTCRGEWDFVLRNERPFCMPLTR
ncbi:MAG: archaeosine biosynthesis radical SAM protein RaSEA [Methanolinea sp.]|nr:archaeosine biosynthesis radical SAM protein RaSEA [Methanolinea sp.]